MRDRARRRSERRIKAAAFPREKSLRGFDFDENPNIDPAVIHTLATCEWVKKGLPLCLIGDSGTGKSDLLIALGTEAAMAGFRVKYTLATKLVNELVEAADDLMLTKTIARYGRVGLLCIGMYGSGPFGESSGQPVPMSVENFHLLKQQQGAEHFTAPDGSRCVNLLNWDGRGTPEGLFPRNDEDR
ncbi:ATP-binding protein [Saccharopolyspora pogona]|uniref:ATP-binding protein n=1 Tax=Saccharopolyspora pogona TaxID=333966 RepID=UPI00295A6888|nr:ATP-binding protein [Saccharopolyspora pogona]